MCWQPQDCDAQHVLVIPTRTSYCCHMKSDPLFKEDQAEWILWLQNRRLMEFVMLWIGMGVEVKIVEKESCFRRLSCLKKRKNKLALQETNSWNTTSQVRGFLDSIPIAACQEFWT